MKNYFDKTILVTGPKRAGKTLLLRLFDGEPDIMHYINEAFFWEHVFNCQQQKLEEMFIDMYRHFSPRSLYDAFVDREILPCLKGVYSQYNPPGSKEKFKILETGFNLEVFIGRLTELKECETVSDIWNVLSHAYGDASPMDCSRRRTAFMMSGDSGKSIIATHKSLADCRSIFIVRDPYVAMDSLKTSRILRGVKILHPINFSRVLSYYRFIMQNKERILHPQCFRIKFEDLIAKPVETMQRVAKHCDISYSENLVTPTLLGKPWGTNSMFKDEKGIDVGAATRGLKALNPEEIKFISRQLADFIDYFGYQNRG